MITTKQEIIRLLRPKLPVGFSVSTEYKGGKDYIYIRSPTKTMHLFVAHYFNLNKPTIWNVKRILKAVREW